MASKSLALQCTTYTDIAQDSKDNPEDVPSNVTRIKDAIKPVDAKGIQQKVYYLQGIGTSNSLIDKWVGGATGAGVVDDVCEAYCNLADNYTKGDEIFLFGFSRGAFIVRSLAGLISQQGLRKRDKEKFKDEFLQLQKQVDPQLAENTKTPKAGASGDGVQIKAIGVWDTVGQYLSILVLTASILHLDAHDIGVC